MLISLKVRNIALIEDVEIRFCKGMMVLSGETGAGKSILIDSINLVLGERFDRGLIRNGCERASVEAEIDLADCPQAMETLREEEIETDGTTICIQREMTSAGKNICRICGSMVTLAFLKKVTAFLVDVHGQHEHQRLLDAKTHLAFLDSFGDKEFQALKEKTAEIYQQWRQASLRYSQLRKENTRKEERQEYLSTRVRELDELNLKVGQADQLSAEKAKMALNEKLDETLRNAYQCISAGREFSALDKMKEAVDYLSTFSQLSPDSVQLYERMKSAYYEIEEVAREISDRIDSEAFDSERYAAIEEKLDRIRKLERKYQMTADHLAEHHDEMKEELEHLSTMEDRLRRAENEFRLSLQQYRKSAQALTLARKTLAQSFEKQMESQLTDLGMLQTKFTCVFEDTDNPKKIPTAEGDDNVVFYIAPNPGEPMKPLDKTASGGELSRLMLALKTCAADRDSIPTIIFDEIDTGISGHVAQAVAQKMAEIAQYHQILCITHLPQIASIADTQYLVEKHVADDRTFTQVNELSDEQRVSEIARLIGVTQKDQESGLLHARTILQNSANWKHSRYSDKKIREKINAAIKPMQ